MKVIYSELLFVSLITTISAFQQHNRHHLLRQWRHQLSAKRAAFSPYPFMSPVAKQYHSPALLFSQNDGNVGGSVKATNGNPDKSTTLVERIFDTMTPAGFDAPMISIFGKRTALILAGLMVWRWYRAKFMLKQKFTEKQPAWGHVITSKDQEKNLHAWTCKNCGTTMFIAKGREIRFFNRWVECYNCGARGKDSFYDRREEIAADDDTDFTYENPLDYVSRGERKKLEKEVKEGEGRGEKVDVVALMEEKGLAEKGESVDDERTTEELNGTEEKVAPAKSEKKTEKKTKAVADDMDELGMDL